MSELFVLLSEDQREELMAIANEKVRQVYVKNNTASDSLVYDTLEYMKMMLSSSTDVDSIISELNLFLKDDAKEVMDLLCESMRSMVNSVSIHSPTRSPLPSNTTPPAPEEPSPVPTTTPPTTTTTTTTNTTKLSLKVTKTDDQRKADRRARFGVKDDNKDNKKRKDRDDRGPPAPSAPAPPPAPDSPPPKRAKIAPREAASDAAQGAGVPAKRGKKCMFYPNCAKEDCPFFHPTEPCPDPLVCIWGPKACQYVHPMCKFGRKCSRVNCAYDHPKALKIDCKNGFSCPLNPLSISTSELSEDGTPAGACLFKHPPVACKFGKGCRNTYCTFSHAYPCQFGIACKIPGCTFSHSLTKEIDVTSDEIALLSSTLPPSPTKTDTEDQDIQIDI